MRHTVEVELERIVYATERGNALILVENPEDEEELNQAVQNQVFDRFLITDRTYAEPPVWTKYKRV